MLYCIEQCNYAEISYDFIKIERYLCLHYVLKTCLGSVDINTTILKIKARKREITMIKILQCN